jgi:hypothetical protein
MAAAGALAIRLSPRGRALASSRTLAVRAIAAASDASGNRRTTVKRLLLRTGSPAR